jgi:hypothetical protein
MDNTTSRKQARARLVEQQNAAKAERQAREKANITDLTEFTVRANQADAVDVWLADKIEKVKAEAEARRHKHKVAAGQALQTMRMRGESVPAIAEQAQVSIGRVREFLRLAADANDEAADKPATTKGQVVAMPSRGGGANGGRAEDQAAAGAH